MPFLSQRDADTLRQQFSQELASPVQILYFTERESPLTVPGRLPCRYCKETRLLLEEVSGLSEKLELQVYDVDADGAKAQEYGIERVPAIVLLGKEQGRLRYFGIPSGNEFATLIATLFDVSKGTTTLSAPTHQALTRLTQPVQIKVFVTPT